MIQKTVKATPKAKKLKVKAKKKAGRTVLSWKKVKRCNRIQSIQKHKRKTASIRK